MRVLYIIHTTKNDGSTISFLSMISGLQSEGIEISIAGPSPSEAFIKRLNSINVSNITYNSTRIAESIFPPKNQRGLPGNLIRSLRILNLLRRKYLFYRDLLRIAKQSRPDIIHTNVGTIREGFWVAKKLSIPHVWHIREYQEKGSTWSPFPNKSSLDSCLKQSSVIAISRGLLLYYNLSESVYKRVIYNGVAHASQTCYSWPKEKFFLCSSRISVEKGIDDVIRAFSAFKRSKGGYELVILGDGDEDYIQHLKHLASELQCDDSIRWEGYRKDVLDYMRRSTALIVASHSEGFGRMTAEACFSGCIVIGRACSATKEVIDHVGGFLFDTVNGLYERMLELSELQEIEYRDIAIRAQSRAVNSYSIEQNIEGVYQFYKTILNRDSI